MALERTLALIKPDCCSRPWIEELLRKAPVPEGEEAPEDAPPVFELQPEERAALLGGYPAGKPGSGDDIAAVVDFLLSDSAGFISGVALPVDGAYR